MNLKTGLLAVIGSLVIVSQFSRIFTSPTPLQNKSITFVVAHPDDETMFFGPTVRNVVDPAKNNKVSILVLSNGGAEGLGAVREQEMLVAAQTVGVPPENVKVVNDPRLPDSMNVTWDSAVVAEHVGEAAREWGTQAIVTFDEKGVSGHPNHKQTSAGAIRYGSHAIAEDPGFAVYTLYSVPLYRKYLFSLDSIMSRLQRLPQVDYVLISGQFDYHAVRNALVQGHKSQITWYRRLWTFFSRYMIVNDLGTVNLQRVLERNQFQEDGAAQLLKEAAAKKVVWDSAAADAAAEAAASSAAATVPPKREKTRYRERKHKTKESIGVTRHKPELTPTAYAGGGFGYNE